MSKRTERRAAERESRKLAYQQLRQAQSQQVQSQDVVTAHLDAEPSNLAIADIAVPQPEVDLLARARAFFDTRPAIAESAPISEAQLTANRANAKLSRGPLTPEGKSKSSQNAVKHGLTGKTVVLATEDVIEYEHQLNSYVELHEPANEEELRLVKSMLDSLWRLNRVQDIESAIYLKGRLESAGKFEDHSPLERRALIQAEVYLKYEKSIRNLNVQDARLRRMLEKDRAELQRLQTIRKREQSNASEATANTPLTRNQVPNGFDFSTHLQAELSSPNYNPDSLQRSPESSERIAN